MGHPIVAAWFEGLGCGGGFAAGGADGVAGLPELIEGVGDADEDERPKDDEDSRAVAVGEPEPQMEEGSSVADAEKHGDSVARETAGGEGDHELLQRHFERAGGEDEGAERHRRRQNGGERDGEDGVRFHPSADSLEDARRDAFFDEGHASGLADTPGEPAAECGAGSRDGDEQEGIRVLGGVEHEHDVGDAGDGERDEGGIDGGDEEEANEAIFQEQVHPLVMRSGEGGACEGGDEAGEGHTG
jgi:hypothetical protein